jgi:site-specific DNA-cytosine methylase
MAEYFQSSVKDFLAKSTDTIQSSLHNAYAEDGFNSQYTTATKAWALTNRERARLQTFPDSFVFEGTKESVRRQIGMAVPPEGAKIIFEAIIKTLEKVEYKSVKPNIEFRDLLI